MVVGQRAHFQQISGLVSAYRQRMSQPSGAVICHGGSQQLFGVAVLPGRQVVGLAHLPQVIRTGDNFQQQTTWFQHAGKLLIIGRREYVQNHVNTVRSDGQGGKITHHAFKAGAGFGGHDDPVLGQIQRDYLGLVLAQILQQVSGKKALTAAGIQHRDGAAKLLLQITAGIGQLLRQRRVKPGLKNAAARGE